MRVLDRAPGLAALLLLSSASCVGTGSEPATGTTVARHDDPIDVGVAPVPLRRLTREEYNNTVRDLLADTTRPAQAFPPDEAIGGFESNNVAPVTPLLVERYMDAAEALAATARGRIEQLAPCPADQSPEICARSFVESFGRRAFRRPLDDEERSTLLAVYSEKARTADHAGGIQLTLEVMLQAPQFLYRVEPADGPGARTRPLTGYEIATRLSYFIWESTPDDLLLDDAAAGRLGTPEGVEKAARRLLADPRAVDGVRSFHRQWLGLAELETVSKDGALAATLTPELKHAMVEETLRFAVHAVLAGGDVVETLLTSSKSFVNAPLARLYGVSMPAQPKADDFALVEMPLHQRSGVLTHASVMTVLSNADQTSPILRGKFVREKLLCQGIPPPPPDVNITPPRVNPTLTTKERFVQHRTDPTCAGCHELMDPIGFGFEHYDALGVWHSVEGAHAVDAVGELSSTGDADGAFDGAVALGARLAGSERVRRCVATQWFRFAVGRSERDGDASSIAAAYRAFSREGFDVRELQVAIARSHAFRHVQFEEGTAP